jgi:hypothetical protein
MQKRIHLIALGAPWAVALVILASQAHAQDFVRPDCASLIGSGHLAAQSPLTARWYRRFWTGDCGGLSGCLSGSPNWNDVVGQLSSRSQPSQKQAVLKKACRLGALIGLEWTRPRTVRRIDTGDLQSFKSTLNASGDVMTALNDVEAQARMKLDKGANSPSAPR